MTEQHAHGTAFIDDEQVIKVKDLMKLLEYRIKSHIPSDDKYREQVQNELRHLKNRIAAHCNGLRDITLN